MQLERHKVETLLSRVKGNSEGPHKQLPHNELPCIGSVEKVRSYEDSVGNPTLYWTEVRVRSDMPTPPGGWLGLGAEEGRGKLRKASGRRMQPAIRGLPNGTSWLRLITLIAPTRERELPEGKHLSRGRKRN